ncbi:MAG: lipopolysaccharide export system protein LptA [Marinobacter maritimus]|jgi:lipopolysaccharide export system protein LptA|uniref:lipopolysaccharide transport periplasmic protein LptA n=1 Tax=Marinobacter maritimus TaxID=277961 RepID=UPI000BCA31F0|nr:lipopolysaccharide transport periplasmic protein LptA [Marinobacter maritimus]MBL1272605.1 lipopolysaccharide transport periplasmic protein LptA [Oceanospirillales bacterium]
MKPLSKPTLRLLATILAVGLAAPAVAFDLNSDKPITVSADSARLDDGKGIATYTGAVELIQGKTRLTAERVVLYRSADGLNRIEANGSPARYQQPVTSGEGETDARALNITWSASDKRLTFEREAEIEQNGNVFRGDIIHYDTEQRVVTAEGSEDTGSGPGRVEMVIQPGSGTINNSD